MHKGRIFQRWKIGYFTLQECTDMEKKRRMKDEILFECIQQYRERLFRGENCNAFEIKWNKMIQRFEMKKNLYLYAGKYEKKWQRMLKRYKTINIVGIQFMGIGETIPRLYLLMKDTEEDSKETLNVVLPTFCETYIGGIYNRRIFDLFGKKLYFIKESNIDFWTYVIVKHAEMLNKRKFRKYEEKRPEVFPVSLGSSMMSFNEKEIREGEQKMKRMGIEGEFVCLYARENRAKELTYISNVANDTYCRDCDINSYLKAGLYLEELGYQLVRMGKYERNKCNIPKVIDYANDFYDEFMDFYLLSKCKLIVGSVGGWVALAGFWGKPVLYTNLVVLCFGMESFGKTGYEMYIPKKFWSERKKRYLNLYDMLDASNIGDIRDSQYARQKIIFENNSEEEIYEAVVEMNDRLENRWVVTEEEREDRRKYWMIMNTWKTNHLKNSKRYTMVFAEISYSYLKKNRYLLDVDMSKLN